MTGATVKRWPALVLAMGMAMLFSAWEARAQDAFPAPHPLTVKLEDENGVDVLSGIAHFNIPDAAIGDLVHISTVSSYDSSTQPQPNAYYTPSDPDNFVGGLGFSDNRDFSTTFNSNSWFPRPAFQVKVAGIAGSFFINSDHSLQSFDGSTLTGTGVTSWTTPTNYTPPQPLILNTSFGTWVFTARDGTRVDIDTSKKLRVANFTQWPGNFSVYLGVATKITYPSGRIVRINYRSDCTANARVQSVTRNDGLMLKYVYADSTCAAKLTNVIAINTAYEYCDPMADTCAVSGTWRRSQYGYGWVNNHSVYNVTDQRGVLSRFNMDKWGRVASYKPAGASEDTLSFKYCMSYYTTVNASQGNQVPTLSQTDPGKADADEVFCGEMTAPAGYNMPAWWAGIYNRIVTATHGGQNWGYSLPAKLAPGDSPYPRQYTINRPVGPQTMVNINTQPGGGLTDYIDIAHAIVGYTDPESQRVAHAQVRGKPAETYTYDARGNVLSNGITSASFDASCANIVTCNQPNWVHDAAGHQADFTYDPVHGGVLTQTLPADAGGVRPQKRFTYVQRYAWFLNSASVMTRSTEPVWLLATESYCRTGAAAAGGGCVIAGDEVVTTYDYGPDSGPNNLWLRGTVVTASGQSLRSCVAYNKFGDKISQTSPRAGLAVCP